MIEYADFERVDMLTGVILEVEDFPCARKPSYRVKIDFGPEMGIKQSSVQATNYRKEELVGIQVVCVVNFPPKNIAGYISEVLVLGVDGADGALALLTPSQGAVRSHGSGGGAARPDGTKRGQMWKGCPKRSPVRSFPRRGLLKNPIQHDRSIISSSRGIFAEGEGDVAISMIFLRLTTAMRLPHPGTPRAYPGLAMTHLAFSTLPKAGIHGINRGPRPFEDPVHGAPG